MSKKKKYYYCFRPNLNTHIQFYEGWVNEAKKHDVPIVMITFLHIHKYIKSFKKVNKLRKEKKIKIIPTIPYLSNIIMFIYFYIQLIIFKRVIIHLKKVSISPVFSKLKCISKRVKLIIDLEGDPELEMDYLKKNTYQDGFYSKRIESLIKEKRDFSKKIDSSDAIICVNQVFSDRLKTKFPKNSSKVNVIPTGVNTSNFYYNSSERQLIRSKLSLENSLVMIYVGNVYYSWQNISKSLKIFMKLKKYYSNLKFIILTRKVDMNIVIGFIKKYDLDINDIILDNVSNDKVRLFLNAADLGILIRDNHLMNKVASPGKIGEYVACGLPIITTAASSFYSEKLRKSGQAIILNDDILLEKNIEDINDFIKNILSKSHYNLWRSSLSKKNSKYFSNTSFGVSYSEILKKL